MSIYCGNWMLRRLIDPIFDFRFRPEGGAVTEEAVVEESGGQGEGGE